MEKKATMGRVILLVIVFVLIWFLIIAKFDAEIEEIEKINSSFNENNNAIQAETQQVSSTASVQNTQNTRQIVTDRQVLDLDREGTLVIKTDGNYYEVKEGAFILDRSVVEIDENGKKVEFLDSPRRTLTTNE